MFAFPITLKQQHCGQFDLETAALGQFDFMRSRIGVLIAVPEMKT